MQRRSAETKQFINKKFYEQCACALYSCELSDSPVKERGRRRPRRRGKQVTWIRGQTAQMSWGIAASSAHTQFDTLEKRPTKRVESAKEKR